MSLKIALGCVSRSALMILCGAGASSEPNETSGEHHFLETLHHRWRQHRIIDMGNIQPACMTNADMGDVVEGRKPI